MLETLIQLNPNLEHELLCTPFGLTDLGKFIFKLYHRLYKDLLKAEMFGPYLEDHAVLPEEFLYPALDLFPEKTILTFKYNKK